MAFCGNCGTKLEDGVRFCPSCGQPVEPMPQSAGAPGPAGSAGGPNAAQRPAPPAAQQDFSARLQQLNNTADSTAQFDPADIQQNKTMAVLAYLSFLVLVPLFAAKESRFARYHANQGLTLALCELVLLVLQGIVATMVTAAAAQSIFGGPSASTGLLGLLGAAIGLAGLGIIVLAVVGIVNAANGRAKELPLVGKIRLLH